MATLCRMHEAGLAEVAKRRVDVLEMDAALNGISKLKRDRVAIRAWFRSGLSPEEFSRREDFEDFEFARMIDEAAEAMRLQPIHEQFRVYTEDLVVGVDAIADALGRTRRTTERLVAKGKLPVGTVHGLPVSSEGVLRPFRAQKSRRGDDRPRWYRPQWRQLYSKPWKAKHGQGLRVYTHGAALTLERALVAIDAHLGLNVRRIQADCIAPSASEPAAPSNSSAAQGCRRSGI